MISLVARVVVIRAPRVRSRSAGKTEGSRVRPRERRFFRDERRRESDRLIAPADHASAYNHLERRRELGRRWSRMERAVAPNKQPQLPWLICIRYERADNR